MGGSITRSHRASDFPFQSCHQICSGFLRLFLSSSVPDLIRSWVHQFLNSSVPEFISSWSHLFLISSVPDLISSWSHQFLISSVPDLISSWFQQFLIYAMVPDFFECSSQLHLVPDYFVPDFNRTWQRLCPVPWLLGSKVCTGSFQTQVTFCNS